MRLGFKHPVTAVFCSIEQFLLCLIRNLPFRIFKEHCFFKISLPVLEEEQEFPQAELVRSPKRRGWVQEVPFRLQRARRGSLYAHRFRVSRDLRSLTGFKSSRHVRRLLSFREITFETVKRFTLLLVFLPKNFIRYDVFFS